MFFVDKKFRPNGSIIQASKKVKQVIDININDVVSLENVVLDPSKAMVSNIILQPSSSPHPIYY